MNKLNLLSKSEMKKVLGGVEEEGGWKSCRFKYKYSENGAWTGWSDSIMTRDANAQCMQWIANQTDGIVHCGYDCLYE